MNRRMKLAWCAVGMCLAGFAAVSPLGEQTRPTMPLRTASLEPMPLPVFDTAASASGEWLVVTGGFDGSLNATPAIQVHHAIRGWRPVSTQLAHPRARHTQTTLPDGRILVVGGVQGAIGHQADDALAPLHSAEIVHPLMTGSEVLDLTEPLVGHTAHLLPDGRVAIVGGDWVRLFDADTNAFSEAIRLKRPRRHHAAVLWLREEVPQDSAPGAKQQEGDDPEFRLVEQELSINLVPTARGASIGATMEPQRVEIPQAVDEPAPRAKRLVLLIVGGEDESSIEEVDLEARRSRLWETALASLLSDAAAIACADGRVLVVGGVEQASGGSSSSAASDQAEGSLTWWLSADQRITPGPDVDLPVGTASAVMFIDPLDGSISVLGGEQRRPDRIEALQSGRLIRGSGRRIFGLSLPAPSSSFGRRCWIRCGNSEIAAVGGYRFVSEQEARESGETPGVHLRAEIDVIRLPSPIGGD